MQKIHIFADSPCDLSPGEASELGIEVLPIMITYGGVTRAEFTEIDPREFCKVLSELDEIPTTAQIIPVSFLEYYKNAVAGGATHIIVVTISATGSGTYTSAIVGRDLYYSECGEGVPIEVIDSRGYSMMYGQVARHAALMRRDGAEFGEIVSSMREMCSRMEALFLVFSLKHLRKSGRINGGAAFIGEALGLRPVLRCFDGYIDVISKARGDKNVISKTVELLDEYIDKQAEQNITIVFGDVPESYVDQIEQLVKDTFRPRSVERLPIGCCVSANTGPNVVAVIYSGTGRKWEK